MNRRSHPLGNWRADISRIVGKPYLNPVNSGLPVTRPQSAPSVNVN